MRIFQIIAFILCLLPSSVSALPDFNHAIQATYRVFTADRGRVFLGSAFVWQDDNGVTLHAVTNAHVVKDHKTVLLQNHMGTFRSATVVRSDRARDLALLSLDKDPNAAVSAALRPIHARGLKAANTPAKIADPVYALGAPLGLPIGVSVGYISLLNVPLEPQSPVQFIRHDAAVNPGSSGGPLINEDGEVVGMNSQIADGSRLFVGIAYAIPADTITAFVADTLKPVPTLGLQTRPVSPVVAAALNVVERGLLVDNVRTNGIADKAGIMAGDILLRIASKPIHKPSDLGLNLDRRTSQIVAVQLLRNNKLVNLTLDLRTLTFDLPAPHEPTVKPVALDTIGLELDSTNTITKIDPAGIAYKLGLASGDTILALNERSFDTFTTLPVVGIFRISRYGDTLHLPFDRALKSGKLRILGGGNFIDPEVITF